MSDQYLTVEQAYRAMFYFLEHEYDLTKADEIGGLLSSLSWEITQRHGPADAAAWQDWRDAVRKALTISDNASP
ncbi:hypothetical protein [Cupriavidus sp. YAF13]|uniref:hypothetical protein n=1 Tax=Cupriavidus sp. YAF13 TaxID=3233075 RepID=UPI003F92EB0F